MEGFRCLSGCPDRLTSRVPRDAERCLTSEPTCVFCRHQLAAAAGLDTGASSSDAIPLDARDTAQWEPHPDHPGDTGWDDPSNGPEDTFNFHEFGQALD